MSKISLIIKREYTTRVMKKSFIILTFLTPLLFAGMITVPLWLASLKDNTKKHIYVIDRTNQYQKVLKSNETYEFDFVDKLSSDKLFNLYLIVLFISLLITFRLAST